MILKADNLIKEFPILYNQKANGRTQIYKLAVIMDDGNPCIIKEYGQLDGKMTIDKKPIYKGKNIGRSNETTPVQQAISEAESDYQGKLDKKYCLDVTIVGDNIGSDAAIPDPMLAKSFDDYSAKMVYPVYVQPKLDGIRCVVKNVNNELIFYSRRGKVFSHLQHIADELYGILEEGETLDGELYSNEINFQEIVAAVRTQNEIHPDIMIVEYHVYDMPHETMTYSQRKKALEDRIADGKYVKIVETQEAKDIEDIMAFHQQMTTIGYEGTMIRTMSGKYRFKYRSPDLLKLKDFQSEEFEIIGAHGGAGKAERQAIMECVTPEGKPFDVRCEGTDAEREWQLENIDSIVASKIKLTVIFQGYTNDGIPRFPVGAALRDYE